MMNGYDRIKALYLQGTRRDKMLKKIVKFLMMRPNMNDLYLNEEKNLVGMMNFIYEQVRPLVVNNGVGMDDEDVYDIVINYFTKSNEELGINKPIPKVNVSNNKPAPKEEPKNNGQLALELE